MENENGRKAAKALALLIKPGDSVSEVQDKFWKLMNEAGMLGTEFYIVLMEKRP